MDEWNLTGVLAEIWAELARGKTDRRHAFHTPVLATNRSDGPAARTVVLRGVDPLCRQLVCHTDFRSGKVTELTMDPQVTWLFYEPRRKVQLRIKAHGKIHHDDAVARKAWHETKLTSRRAYLSQFPSGQVLSSPGSGLSADLEKRAPTEEESEPGWKNFTVLVTNMAEIDVLYLRAAGHVRARFCWTEADGWQGSWIAP